MSRTFRLPKVDPVKHLGPPKLETVEAYREMLKITFGYLYEVWSECGKSQSALHVISTTERRLGMVMDEMERQITLGNGLEPAENIPGDIERLPERKRRGVNRC